MSRSGFIPVLIGNPFSNPFGNPIVYTLIFSRNRSNDAPVVFDDVTVSDASLMIDIISFRSRYERSAGWLYPCRSTGTGSFERGRGVRLMYGKTRVNFPDFTPPYYLEFFPEWGRFPFAISVYTGNPPPSPPPSPIWIPSPGSDREFRFFPDESKIKTRIIADQSALFDAFDPSTGGFIYQNWLYSRFDNSLFQRREIGTWNPILVMSQGEYEGVLSSPDALPL